MNNHTYQLVLKVLGILFWFNLYISLLHDHIFLLTIFFFLFLNSFNIFFQHILQHVLWQIQIVRELKSIIQFNIPHLIKIKHDSV